LITKPPREDLIVSAYKGDPSSKSEAGKTYVVFGKANNSAIDLSVIADVSNPTGGLLARPAPTIKSSKPSPLTSPALETERPLQSFVSSPLITKPPRELLAAIVLIVGATHADLNGKKDVGKSYVVFGKADSSAINLSTIATGNHQQWHLDQ
jgi:hypothetical protein